MKKRAIYNLVILTISAFIIIIMAFLYFRNIKKPECAAKFTIISRDKWHAVPPHFSSEAFRYRNPPEQTLSTIVIHHSASLPELGVKQIQSYQILHGFDDIAYNYIIGSNGEIFEGRDLNYLGAHAGSSKEAKELKDSIKRGLCKKSYEDAARLDPDYGTIGICIIGNFTEEEPSHCQLKSLEKLINILAAKYSISNILMHYEVRQKLIIDKGLTPCGPATVCPGQKAYEPVRSIIRRLRHPDGHPYN
jgi:hypothetical protein